MYLDELNERQLEVCKETEGYIRVIAGAGTGKTRVLVSRYLYLVKELGIDLDSILCLTFTRKACNEMLSRIRQELGEELELPYILTYHSFGSRFLKEEIGILNYSKSFRIFDERDTKKVLTKIYSDHGIKLDNFTLEEIRTLISKEKSKEEYIPRMMDRDFEEHILTVRKCLEDQIIDSYLLNQRKGRWLDFDDLIYYTHYILKNFEQIKFKWQDKFSYFEVDEAQDTSKIEYDILEMLSSHCKNLFVVGDPDQNIYEWRNSDNKILLNFSKVHKDCKTFILVDNYRSTKSILDASNKLISNNKNRVKKDLYALKEDGVKVEYFQCETEVEAGDKISKLIKESIDRKEDYKDNAILFRCSFYSMSLENVLRNQKIPYDIIGAPSFYELSEIQDVLSLIKIVIEEDDKSLLRMINRPTRKFGTKKAEYLLSLQLSEPLLVTLKMHRNDIEFVGTDIKEFLNAIENIQEHLDTWNVNKALNTLLEDTRYMEYIGGLKNPSHLENLNSFIYSIRSETNDSNITLKEYYLNNLKKREAESKSKNSVHLLTIHAAKGLEFKNVYVIGLDDPFFPHHKTLEERSKTGLEEERRLLYVAMTRAKDRLYLFSENDISGKNSHSRFIDEIFSKEEIYNQDEDDNEEIDEEDVKDEIDVKEEKVEKKDEKKQEDKVSDENQQTEVDVPSDISLWDLFNSKK